VVEPVALGWMLEHHRETVWVTMSCLARRMTTTSISVREMVLSTMTKALMRHDVNRDSTSLSRRFRR